MAAQNHWIPKEEDLAAYEATIDKIIVEETLAKRAWVRQLEKARNLLRNQSGVPVNTAVAWDDSVFRKVK